jgi:hemolysin activation/secretion protein
LPVVNCTSCLPGNHPDFDPDCLVQIAWAQTPAERAASQAEQIERNRAQDRLAVPPPSAPQGLRVQLPQGPSSQPGARCIDVEDIVVSGIRSIGQERIAVVTAPFEGRCLGLAEINAVLKAITFAYVDRGYITSRAYLVEQDLSDGTLQVAVIEGKLQSIVLNDASEGESSAFPGMLGKPLNLRDIEQGLEVIGRLPSVDATMTILPGIQPGDSVLSVERLAGRPWQASVVFDNLGEEATGHLQTGFTLGYDDLLGLNDRLSLNYRSSMADGGEIFSSNRPGGNGWSARYEIPYGYWMFAAAASSDGYRSSIDGTQGPIETSGESVKFDLSAARVLHRDQLSRTTLTATITRKSNESFILDTLLETQSRNLTIANLELIHARRLWGGQAFIAAGYSRGLDIWDAFDDDTAPDGSPRGRFAKVDLRLGYARNWSLGALQLAYDGQAAMQWSPEPLFSSEQMSLGGDASVRGVDSAVLYGNRAALLRNEWSVTLPELQLGGARPVAARFKPYLAFDIGKVWDQPEYGVKGGTLAGAAIGLRTGIGGLNLDVSYAELVRMPGSDREFGGDPGVVSATLAVAF